MDQLIKVFATGPLPKQVKEKLARFADFKSWEEPTEISESYLLEQIKDRTAVICLLGDKMTAEVMDAAPELKLIANVAVGFDNVESRARKEARNSRCEYARSFRQCHCGSGFRSAFGLCETHCRSGPVCAQSSMARMAN